MVHDGPAGGAVTGERLARTGGEEDREVPLAGEETLPRQREQRPRREGAATNGPVLAQGYHQVLAPGAEADVRRQVEALEFPVPPEKMLRGEEGGPAARELPPEAGLARGVD